MQPHWWYLLNSSWNLSAVSISPPRTPDLQFLSRVDRHTHSPFPIQGSFLSLLCPHCPSLPLPHRAADLFYNEVFSMTSIKLCINQAMSLFWIKSLSLPLPVPNKIQTPYKDFQVPQLSTSLSMFNYNSTSLQLSHHPYWAPNILPFILLLQLGTLLSF